MGDVWSRVEWMDACVHGNHVTWYLSRVEELVAAALHQEHVDEVDEDAGSRARVRGPEGQPLVEDHEHQVAKETQQEEQLREEHQVHVVALPEVSAGRTQEIEEISIYRTETRDKRLHTHKWLKTLSTTPKVMCTTPIMTDIFIL